MKIFKNSSGASSLAKGDFDELLLALLIVSVLEVIETMKN